MVSATSAAVTRSNLHTQTFWNIYNLINSRSNVVDPHPDGTSGKRKFVYSRTPDVSGQKFKGYPFVVCNPATLEFSRFMLGRTASQVAWELLLEVYSSDTFRSEETGTDPKGVGLTWLDQISDDIVETFNSKTNKETLQGYGHFFVTPNVTSTDTITTDNEVVYVREIKLNCRNAVLTISA